MQISVDSQLGQVWSPVVIFVIFILGKKLHAHYKKCTGAQNMSGGPRASELLVGGMFHTYVKEGSFKVNVKLEAAHKNFPQINATEHKITL